jgi:hypothetical protein
MACDQHRSMTLEWILLSAYQRDPLPRSACLDAIEAALEGGTRGDEFVIGPFAVVRLGLGAARSELLAKEDVSDASAAKCECQRLSTEMGRELAVWLRAHIRDGVNRVSAKQRDEAIDVVRGVI